jgi:hypothetical protein
MYLFQILYLDMNFNKGTLYFVRGIDSCQLITLDKTLLQY